MAQRIWSPIAGKGGNGQWVKIDGKAGLKAIALEEKDHLKWVEGDDNVREMMVKRNKDRVSDTRHYTKKYLDKKEGKITKEKEGRVRKGVKAITPSTDGSADGSAKSNASVGHNKKISKTDVKPDVKPDDLEPGVDPDPIDPNSPAPYRNPLSSPIIDDMSSIMLAWVIDDPNYVAPEEYGSALLPTDMGAKGGAKKDEKDGAKGGEKGGEK